MRIKLSPSAVHSGAALASLLCVGKFKVGYFLDSLRIVLRTVSISMTRMRETLQLQLMALCHSQVTLTLCTAINITETTYSCQFQYEFGNQ